MPQYLPSLINHAIIHFDNNEKKRTAALAIVKQGVHGDMEATIK